MLPHTDRPSSGAAMLVWLVLAATDEDEEEAVAAVSAVCERPAVLAGWGGGKFLGVLSSPGRALGK